MLGHFYDLRSQTHTVRRKVEWMLNFSQGRLIKQSANRMRMGTFSILKVFLCYLFLIVRCVLLANSLTHLRMQMWWGYFNVRRFTCLHYGEPKVYENSYFCDTSTSAVKTPSRVLYNIQCDPCNTNEVSSTSNVYCSKRTSGRLLRRAHHHKVVEEQVDSVVPEDADDVACVIYCDMRWQVCDMMWHVRHAMTSMMCRAGTLWHVILALVPQNSNPTQSAAHRLQVAECSQVVVSRRLLLEYYQRHWHWSLTKCSTLLVSHSDSDGHAALHGWHTFQNLL